MSIKVVDRYLGYTDMLVAFDLKFIFASIFVSFIRNTDIGLI